MRKSKKLKGKLGLFALEYIVDLNATQAAIRAGYSKKTARSQGQRLLTRVDIKEAIQAYMDKRAEKTEITVDWVESRLVENVERAMQMTPVIDKDGNETGKHSYNGTVANRALELLGKQRGMFVDRKEVGQPGEFEKLTDDELRNSIKRRAGAIGLRVVGA